MSPQIVDRPSLEEQLANIAVKVETTHSRGSGFVLYASVDAQHAYVLTALHCILGPRGSDRKYPRGLTEAGEITLSFLSPRQATPNIPIPVPAGDVLEDQDNDLAIIVLDAAAMPTSVCRNPTPVSTRAPNHGEEFMTLGFPAWANDERKTFQLSHAGGGGLQIFDAYVTDSQLATEGGADQVAGLSGAPTFSRKGNRLVGLITRGTENEPSGALAYNRVQIRALNTQLINSILEQRPELQKLPGARKDRIDLTQGIDTENVEYGEIALNVWQAVDYLKNDLSDEWFRDPLGYKDLLDSKKLAKFLKDNQKESDFTRVCNSFVPKPSYTARPAQLTDFGERLLYQGLVNELAPVLDKGLQGNVYSFRIHSVEHESASPRHLFYYGIEQWKKFQAHTEQGLSESFPYLLTTDISSFFDHIDPARLQEALQNLANSRNPGKTQADNISKCLKALVLLLKRWCPDGGIPQNRDASSFLANAYLHSLDTRMHTTYGHRYSRYMDDIRVFCATKTEAQRAILELTKALRTIGNLSLNDSKTKILHHEDDRKAIAEFCTAGNISYEQIDGLLRGGTRRSVQIAVNMTLRMVGVVLKNPLDATKIDVGRDLRFCLQRLARFARQPYLAELVPWKELVPKLVSLLPDHPWTSQTIMTMLLSVPKEFFSEAVYSTLCRNIVGPETAIYEWQSYHILLLLALHRHDNLDLRQFALDSVKSPDQQTPGATAGSCIYLACIDHAGFAVEILDGLKAGNYTSYLTKRAAIIALRRTPSSQLPSAQLSSSLMLAHETLHAQDSNEFVVGLPPIPLRKVLRNLPDIVSGPRP